jgi:alkylhydroperoxidase family enzyme
MANITKHRNALIVRVVDGTATTSTQDRRSAFEGQGPAAARALIEKVTKHAYKVTDEDIAAAKAAGLSEDAIFELVVSAAVGQSNRQIESALAALEEATRG